MSCSENKPDKEIYLSFADSADMPIRIKEMRIRYSSTSTSGANADYKYNYGYDDAGNIKSAKENQNKSISYLNWYPLRNLKSHIISLVTS